jgi:UDP-N-acetylglucosamine diphosphorylase/glucosamine-1-phosphate N-acetyltransferase|tara:strand:+ start:1362 stop:2096 length:735 start_codon:yes stop_codon:yes gene_type:complete
LNYTNHKELRICILAAGKGSRMNSELPKVLHEINSKPILHFVLETSESLKPKEIILIVGFKKEMVIKSVNNFNVSFAYQKEQKGTAHAIMQCKENLINNSGQTLVLSGDVPYISKNTLKNLIEIHNKNQSLGSIISANIEDPSGYGRIIRKNNEFVKIVEHKEANDDELNINEINSGIYLFDTRTLIDKINLIKDSNKQNEFYLTDIFEFIEKDKISIYNTKQTDEINGINTIEQLNELSKNKK